MKMKTTKKKAIYRPAQKRLSIQAPTCADVEKIEYDADFFKWSHDQAEFLRRGEFKKLDIKNLTEEIESLGISQLDALESYLCILLLHLLKVKYQPSMHTRSWDLSILNSRYHIG